MDGQRDPGAPGAGPAPVGTRQRLIDAAAALLDEGGDAAVTIRAVALRAGVSHNAPYKHFEDRNALLAAVAVADFEALTAAMGSLVGAHPRARLDGALAAFIGYARAHPAHYRLLASDPDIAAAGGPVEAAAMQAFGALASAVEAAQGAGLLPAIPTTALTGLLYSCVHGLIDMHASGRMRSEKGLAGIEPAVDLLLTLLSSKGP